MTAFAIFDAEGFPSAFYGEDIHGSRALPVYGPAPEPTEADPYPMRPIIGEQPNPDCLIPAEAVEITDAQWMDMISHPGLRRWVDGAVVAYEPPPPELQPIVLAVETFFERTTGAEADEIDAAMNAKPVKIRRQWQAARDVFREGSDLWAALRTAIVDLYGPERAAELLAR